MVYHGLPIRMHDYAIVTMIHHDTFETCEAPQTFFALSIYIHADYWAQRQRLSPGPFFQLGFGDQQRAPHKRIRCYGLLIASKRAKQADR